MKIVVRLLAFSAMLFSGCATSYAWKSRVPESMRTVSVASFQNESSLIELGAISTRQILREFQREGTFKIAADGEAALEIQGCVKSVSTGGVVYNRRMLSRFTSHDLKMEAIVSVVDKHSGAVVVDNKRYDVKVPMVAYHDETTAERDASGRLADELARAVVDDVLNLKW